ncbi:MAG: LPS export ABC transporter ATP-binding protein [Desulfobacterales bacterium C00003060]|nr:MAG: LPS export ABC transporter ATP-binding protein [Desulfobacterales bacterium S3730MH5]OEU80371.1 MAG: LPS export ABC transporter ATP-binding protein [Desulfobacterales bacterium C00003060]OEU82454.1 MAG: LPS export ABC transporter ATP-binding protein [Desulfobacterales bacterium S5133MH4]
MARLLAKDLCKIYKSKRVVDSVSLEVESGTVVGLLGPNGAGKTTTFYMIVGLIRPDSGQVFLDGEDITSSPMFVRARKGIGYLPQEASVFRKLTVGNNILAILETLSLSSSERYSRLGELLKEFNIGHLTGRKAYSLSGGERRRVEIARALATTPSFVFLDEPFAGIDPISVIDIQEIIGQLKKQGIAVVISDHNVRETLGVCDRAYILNEGVLVESGSPEAIAASSVAREIYLGEGFTL